MIKKNGFTLAEVLITLAIIGVVATMTLPALMSNTAEQQAKTALKKGINTLTIAAETNQAVDGFDYASLTDKSTTDGETQSLYGLLTKRTNVDYTNTRVVSGHNNYGSHQGAATLAGTENFAVFLRDGAIIMYDPKLTDNDTAHTPLNDGVPHGIPIIYDTNGKKGPNILSNCSKGSLGVKGDSTAADYKSACTSVNRVIKDQFGIRLRGGFAVPNGAASRWAFGE